MDDLCWAAPFARMVDVIKFVKSRGPAYGYNLDMKKSTYLMAPGGSRLSQHEFFERINALVIVSLGLPTDNIKAHPNIISCCQPSVSPTMLAKRSVLQWGCKTLLFVLISLLFNKIF